MDSKCLNSTDVIMPRKQISTSTFLAQTFHKCSSSSSSSSPVGTPQQRHHVVSSPALSDKTQEGICGNTCPPEDFKADESSTIKERQLLCCWMKCGMEFTDLKQLAAHVNDYHARTECPDVDFQCRWQGCPRQGKGFNARYKMLIHIRTHTNEKPHMCEVCKKSFSRLENLKIHNRSHTGEKPYTCTFPGCGKAYSNSSDRFKHVRTHQEEKPYKCKMPGCRKQYTDPSSLRKHVRMHRHTSDLNEVMLNNPLICKELQEVDLKFEEVGHELKFHVNNLNNVNEENGCELYILGDTINQNMQKNDMNNNEEIIPMTQNTLSEHETQRKNINNNETILKTSTQEIFGQKTNYLDQVKGNVDETKHLNNCRSSNETQILFQKHNLHTNVLYTSVQDFSFSSAINDQYMKDNKSLNNSNKQSPVLKYFSSCNEQVNRKSSNEKQKDFNTVFADSKDFLKHNEMCASDSFPSPESVILFPNEKFLKEKFFTLSSNVSNECHKSTTISQCSPPLSKTPPIEHWKKRKLIKQDNESLTPTVKIPKTQTRLAQQNIQSCCESPTQFSSSPLSKESSIHFSSNKDTPSFSNTSPISLSPAGQGTPNYSIVPMFSQQQPLPSNSASPPRSAVVQLMTLSPHSQPIIPQFCSPHYHPYPLISNTYSLPLVFYDTNTHSSMHTPNLSNINISACSFLPPPNSYLQENMIDPYVDYYPAYFMSSRPNINLSCFPPPEKESCEIAYFNNPTFLENWKHPSLFSAANLGHFINRCDFLQKKVPLQLSPLHQNPRIGIAPSLTVKR